MVDLFEGIEEIFSTIDDQISIAKSIKSKDISNLRFNAEFAVSSISSLCSSLEIYLRALRDYLNEIELEDKII